MAVLSNDTFGGLINFLINNNYNIIDLSDNDILRANNEYYKHIATSVKKTK